MVRPEHQPNRDSISSPPRQRRRLNGHGPQRRLRNQAVQAQVEPVQALDVALPGPPVELVNGVVPHGHIDENHAEADLNAPLPANNNEPVPEVDDQAPLVRRDDEFEQLQANQPVVHELIMLLHALSRQIQAHHNAFDATNVQIQEMAQKVNRLQAIQEQLDRIENTCVTVLQSLGIVSDQIANQQHDG